MDPNNFLLSRECTTLGKFAPHCRYIWRQFFLYIYLLLHLEVLTPTLTVSKIYQYREEETLLKVTYFRRNRSHCLFHRFCFSGHFIWFSRSGGRWVVGEGRYVGQNKVNSINIPDHSIYSLPFCSFLTFSSYISPSDAIQYNSTYFSSSTLKFIFLTQSGKTGLQIMMTQLGSHFKTHAYIFLGPRGPLRTPSFVRPFVRSFARPRQKSRSHLKPYKSSQDHARPLI